MGEAGRRGNYQARRAMILGKGWRTWVADLPMEVLAQIKRRLKRGRLPRQEALVPKRDRAKIRRGIKRRLGMTRSDMGRIGAGHGTKQERVALIDALVGAGI